MPARYEGIKRSMKKRYPDESEKQIKTRAAKIYEATRKGGEEHIQTAAARERRLKKADGGYLGRMATGWVPPARMATDRRIRIPETPMMLGNVDRTLSGAADRIAGLRSRFRKKGGRSG